MQRNAFKSTKSSPIENEPYMSWLKMSKSSHRLSSSINLISLLLRSIKILSPTRCKQWTNWISRLSTSRWRMPSCRRNSTGTSWELIGKLQIRMNDIFRLPWTLSFVFRSLNEALESAQPYQTQNLQIFAPQMPLSTAPLCVVLHVKNSSDTDKELRISKQLLCDCPMKKNRLRKEGKREKCVHKEIVEMRPMMACVKAKGTVELSLTFRYDILGQQEVHFTIV